MSDDDPTEGRETDGSTATDEPAATDGPAAGAAEAEEVDPETLKEATVDLEGAIGNLEEAAEALDGVAEYTEPIEREIGTLRSFADRFEARWLAAEGVPPEAADTDGEGDAEPVTAEDLLDAESAQEEALLEAVAALEVAQTELEQAIEDVERGL